MAVLGVIGIKVVIGIAIVIGIIVIGIIVIGIGIIVIGIGIEKTEVLVNAKENVVTVIIAIARQNSIIASRMPVTRARAQQPSQHPHQQRLRVAERS